MCVRYKVVKKLILVDVFYFVWLNFEFEKFLMLVYSVRILVKIGKKYKDRNEREKENCEFIVVLF